MQEFDLIIVGTGSGNSIPSPEFDDWNIALVERDVFGGTCLNKGCIPSKMFVYAGDVAESIRVAEKYGIDAQVNSVDWPSIVQRVFGRIDPIAAGGEDYRTNQCENITVFRGSGAFVGDKVLEVNGEQITAPRIILGAGARSFVPPFKGLDQVPFHTSDTVMRLPELPARMAIIGGGYIACEMGHVFGALGSEVTIINRGRMLLRYEDDDVSARATEIYGNRFRLLMGNDDPPVFRQEGSETVITGVADGTPYECRADVVLVATGRIPNGDELNVAAAGVATDGSRVLVDDTMQTNVSGIYAFGDLSNQLQLKHLANLEAKAAFHNVTEPAERRHVDSSLTPHAVFGHPQIASVGLTERDVKEQDIPYVSAIKNYGDTAYGWAMEDTESFVKLIAHAETRLLLGAHIIGPQSSTLIHQLIQGMAFGQTVDEMASGFMYIHPALNEVVENALLEL